MTDKAARPGRLDGRTRANRVPLGHLVAIELDNGPALVLTAGDLIQLIAGSPAAHAEALRLGRLWRSGQLGRRPVWRVHW